MFKIILVKQVWEGEDEEGQIAVKETTIRELLENPDYEIQAEIEMAGWKNIKKFTEIENNLNKSFYLVGAAQIPIDASQLQYHLASLISGNEKLVQAINPKAVLTEVQYKAYQKAKKRIEDENKQKEEAKRERVEKKKAKKLADATKLLEEHGKEVK